VPPDAQSLIQQLLVLEPSQRLGEQCVSALYAESSKQSGPTLLAKHQALETYLRTSVTQRACDRCDRMSVAGAGGGKVQALKSHPFFAGINWDNLREQPSPPFTPPQHTLGIDEV
jgi:hypothetical protein